MAKSEKERDQEFKQAIKEIREFSIVLYYMVKTATFAWNKKGTAFVTTRRGVIHFECNENFWDRLNQHEQLFLVLHECYHVFLDHFTRFPKVDRTTNKAMDLAVNHSLLRHFSFKRKKMPLLSKIACWVDTVIPGKVLLDTLSAEEYLYALQQEEENNQGKEEDDADGSGEGSSGLSKEEKKAKEEGSMDDHSKMDPDKLKEVLEDILEDLPDDLKEKEGMSEKEVEEAMDTLLKALGQEALDALKQAGSGSFEDNRKIDYERKRKSTWFQFSKRLIKSFKGERDNTVWIPDKRVQHLAEDGMFLPSYKEAENRNGKIVVVLFLDTSVSCDHLRPYFFGFAKALPREVFEVIGFGFTTASYKLNLENPRFRSGGTSFKDFDHIFSKVEAKQKYAFVFTDGEADPVTLANPEKWYWFLDKPPNACNTESIPEPCTKLWLGDFE